MAAAKDFVPSRESDLIAFNTNFAARIATMLATIGITSAQATAFSTAAAAFQAAWDLTKSRSTRSGSAVIVKNQKKLAAVKLLRQYAGIIQKFPGTSDESRSLLGLTVPAVRQRLPAPAFTPTVEKKGISGNTVTLLIHEEGKTGRGLPRGAATVQVYSHVGATVPTDPKAWFFEGATTRSIVSASFDVALPAGTKVWICAAYANDRGEAGPACTPVEFTLVGSPALPTSGQSGGTLSIAA